MWYACSSTIRPETKAVCTPQFDSRDLLWKHIKTNRLHYMKHGPEYEVYHDDLRQYTINLGMFPYEKNRWIGAVLGILLIVIVIFLLILFVVSVTS